MERIVECYIEKAEGFNRDKVVTHLVGLLTGEIQPVTEADVEFTDGIRRAYMEKLNARYTELRMSKQSQVPEGEQQGSSEVSDLPKDV